ncbi:MAG: hypothetical protein WBB45_20495 [Cyclobacteriaceae bacterium]
MLAACSHIKREAVADASLRKRNASLMELYLHQYLDEVEKLAHRGLTKKYGRRQGQTKALKGKLLMAPHLRKNAIHKERFYTEHTVYSADNRYNQLLKKGLEVIKGLPQSLNQSMANRYYLPFLQDLILPPLNADMNNIHPKNYQLSIFHFQLSPLFRGENNRCRG